MFEEGKAEGDGKNIERRVDFSPASCIKSQSIFLLKISNNGRDVE